MAVFLSQDWVAQLDQAIAADDKLRRASGGESLVVQQTVTGADNGEMVWHVAIADGEAHVLAGPAESPDVTFTQDATTARAIGTGELSAQAAFMLGKLRVGGDVAQLIARRELFESLDDVFADVRASTTY